MQLEMGFTTILQMHFYNIKTKTFIVYNNWLSIQLIDYNFFCRSHCRVCASPVCVTCIVIKKGFEKVRVTSLVRDRKMIRINVQIYLSHKIILVLTDSVCFWCFFLNEIKDFFSKTSRES